MGSKSKWIGLIILLVVIGAAAVYLLLGGGPRPEPTVLRGYVGGREDRPAPQPAEWWLPGGDRTGRRAGWAAPAVQAPRAAQTPLPLWGKR